MKNLILFFMVALFVVCCGPCGGCNIEDKYDCSENEDGEIERLINDCMGKRYDIVQCEINVYQWKCRKK